MKTKKNVRFRTVPVAIVKSGQECRFHNQVMVKVKAKTLMSSKGVIHSVPDYTQVMVKT